MKNPEEQLRTQLTEIGHLIGDHMPENSGFILMFFQTNTPQGRMEYISNCDRKDVIRALKEFIIKTEREWGMHVYDGEFGMGGKAK
jgi:hypothetical protein